MSLFTYTHSRCALIDIKVVFKSFFLFVQTANGERRSLKRQKTASASISEANKIEEILEPCAGRQILCKFAHNASCSVEATRVTIELVIAAR